VFKILGGAAWWCLGRPFFGFGGLGEGLDGVSFSFFRDGWARDGGLSWLLFFIFLWERERRGGGWV